MTSAIDLDVAEQVEGILAAKFSSDSWELNVYATAVEFAGLGAVRDTDWASRRVLKVGASAGSEVFWSHADGVVTILVGRDDETWDYSVSVPVALVDELVALVAQPGERQMVSGTS